MYIKECVINEDVVSINIMGQEFRGYVFNDINYPPQKWMIAFGLKLQEVGKMIEWQARHGKPDKIIGHNKEDIISIGFNERGQFIIP